jgi:hypothetical protein
MTNRGWPVVRSIAALEVYMVRLKRAVHRGHLSEEASADLGNKINELRRAIGDALGIRMTDLVLVMDREPTKAVCSRCKNRVAKVGRAYCKRCIDWNRERYDARIGGAQNLKKGKRRLRLLAKAA